jgi:hypothetical protein
MVQQVTDNRLPLAKIHHFLFQKERNLGDGSDYLLKPENHLIFHRSIYNKGKEDRSGGRIPSFIMAIEHKLAICRWIAKRRNRNSQAIISLSKHLLFHQSIAID